MSEPLSRTTDNPAFRDLRKRLSDLAVQWRTTQSHEVVVEYQDTLRQLLALGWDDWLDIDSELPERLMPKEYSERKPSKR